MFPFQVWPVAAPFDFKSIQKQSHNYDKSCQAIALTTPRAKSHVPGAMHHWQSSVLGLSCWPWHPEVAGRTCCCVVGCMLVKPATRHTRSTQWIVWPKPSKDFSLIYRSFASRLWTMSMGAISFPVLSSSCIPMSWCGHCVQDKILKIWNVVVEYHWVAWHIIEYHRISVWILWNVMNNSSELQADWLQNGQDLSQPVFPISSPQNRDENPWPSST